MLTLPESQRVFSNNSCGNVHDGIRDSTYQCAPHFACELAFRDPWLQRLELSAVVQNPLGSAIGELEQMIKMDYAAITDRDTGSYSENVVYVLCRARDFDFHRSSCAATPACANARVAK